MVLNQTLTKDILVQKWESFSPKDIQPEIKSNTTKQQFEL